MDGISHAARMVVARRDVDHPQRERQAAQFGEGSRFARKLIIEELKERGVMPDRNRLLTGEKDLMQLETTQPLWGVREMDGAEGDRQIVVMVPAIALCLKIRCSVCRQVIDRHAHFS